MTYNRLPQISIYNSEELYEPREEPMAIGLVSGRSLCCDGRIVYVRLTIKTKKFRLKYRNNLSRTCPKLERYTYC